MKMTATRVKLAILLQFTMFPVGDCYAETRSGELSWAQFTGAGTMLNDNRQSSAAAAVASYAKAVHNFKSGEDYLLPYYRNFDAYYNPNTGAVYNNAQTMGDQKALFVFQKCMTMSGYPLSEK